MTVKLRMSATGSAGLAREVLDGSLDLAVVSLPGPAPVGLSLCPVAEEPLVAVGQPGHQLAAGPATIAELAADAHGVSPQQIALAWMLAKALVVIPIPGASRPESIIDSAQAADLTLAPAELAKLDQS